VVRMALYLIISLGATSGLFFLAGADFVAAMQLMIYVGGTLVLLIFGVMLTSGGPFISLRTRGGDWVLAAILSASMIGLLVPAALSVRAWRNEDAQMFVEVLREEAAESEEATEEPQAAAAAAQARVVSNQTTSEAPHDTTATEHESPDRVFASPPQPLTAARLGMGTIGARVDKLEPGREKLAGGMSGYLLPFEIVSIHLLVVLVGAAYLARTKRRAGAAEDR
jgi:NADH-quinone oxidoreductase subunit J